MPIIISLVSLLFVLVSDPSSSTAATMRGSDSEVTRLSLLDAINRAPTLDADIDAGVLLMPRWQDAIDDAEANKPFGTRGTKRIQYGGGFGIDVERDEPMFQGGVAWSRFVEDGLSLDLELNGLFFDQDDAADAFGINTNLLLRWHFLRRESWSMYADVGAGLILTTAHVPGRGSGFNFTPQMGVGFSFDIDQRKRLLTGLRWHHISNGSTFEENDARDSAYFYAMISVPY